MRKPEPPQLNIHLSFAGSRAPNRPRAFAEELGDQSRVVRLWRLMRTVRVVRIIKTASRQKG